ncbi:MAG TPA: hypothetical protein VLL08_12675 [Kineosporiaceae bacterium]|nr:hypothetical protein [Kineosporiaceae bacterium]
MITDAQKADIDNRFEFHPATPATAGKHDQVRAQHLDLARWIATHTPPGRHQSLALTALQESMMWSNAAVACDTKPAQQ